MHAADVAVFRWINGWSNDVAPFFDFLSEANKNWVFRIAIAVLLIWMLAANKQTRKAAIFAVCAVVLSNSLTDLLKHSFYSMRPSVPQSDVWSTIMPHGVGWLGSSGTASAHAANMAAIAVIITAFFDWWGVIPIVLAFLTGIARIYVGVHYPSQVLLGWICGVAMGLLVVLSYKLWMRAHGAETGNGEREIAESRAGST